ncbi:MAG: DUF1549 domain-containing protein [Candidatus Solibacter usitatus]|nr:DUF1549 domain-containing protein [Candidatus Solibacter usitatus]
MIKRSKFVLAGSVIAALTGVYIHAQEPQTEGNSPELAVEHAQCDYLGPKQSFYNRAGLAGQRLREYNYSHATMDIARQLPKSSSGQRAAGVDYNSQNIIDQNLFAVWKANDVVPAQKSNDFEFIRRVTLDLTGRIPTAVQTQTFINDLSPDKRVKLVDTLLASTAFVDKWTMYWGDRLRNTIRNVQVNRYAQGRDAFYNYIKSSVQANKSYDKLATELITANGENSFRGGEMNWLVGDRVTGGPVQDIWDAQAVDVSQTFLGLSYVNCVLCHDGRRHLESINLWGSTTTRLEGYEISSFFSRTQMDAVRINPTVPNDNTAYWNILDNVRYRTDYGLGSTTGNRPARSFVGTMRAVPPNYYWTGETPAPGENYRVALARFLTKDLQFARAGVNYIWKEFMTKGLVDPPDMFDLARLDPDNPPPDPWTLQPNQPKLLNDLAKVFIDQKFDLKALMRLIVLS